MTLEELEAVIADLLWKPDWKQINLVGDQEGGGLRINRTTAILLYLSLRSRTAQWRLD